jgi:transcriptional regulator with XRE-family HTH domain
MTPNGNIVKGGVRVYFPRIKDLRVDADKTQLEIAEELHMQRSVYRRYESGQREIPVWAVISLAKYYKTTADYILGLSAKRHRSGK